MSEAYTVYLGEKGTREGCSGITVKVVDVAIQK